MNSQFPLVASASIEIRRQIRGVTLRRRRRLPSRPSRGSGAATLRRLFGSTPLLLVVTAVGVLGGSATFLVAPPQHVEPTTDPSPQHVDSAKQSVDSAKMMFGLMSSGLGSATGSITSVTESAAQVFDAVDTARQASGQIVSGLSSAPSTSSAAAEVEQLTTAVATGIDDVRSLSRSAEQMDELVTPLVGFVRQNDVPGGDDLLEQLTTLQSASRQVTEQTARLGSLQAQLDTISSSLGRSTEQLDSGIGQAQSAARQLEEGLTTLSSARGDTVAAAEAVSDGVGRLTGVLATINNSLDSASTNLTPQGPPSTPAVTVDNSERTALALLVGALCSLATLAIMVGMNHRSRRLRGRFGIATAGRHTSGHSASAAAGDPA